MSSKNPHSKIITKKAREMLLPLGVKQKGRSRLWIGDEKWYVILVEFQPSKARKGTYLDLGITWLWYPKPYFSYDVGGKQGQFVEYKSDEQFLQSFTSLTKDVPHKINNIKNSLSTMQGAYQYASTSNNLGKDEGWLNLNLGVLAILAGKRKTGVDLLKSVESKEVKTSWQEERRIFCETLISKSQNLDELKLWIEEQIILSREMKKISVGAKLELPKN